MFREITRRSLLFLIGSVIWMVTVSIFMFGIPAKVHADESGYTCPAREGDCYWTSCHANYDGVGNILSRTCNGSSYTGTTRCSEKDCVKTDDFIE
jgi:hypothetical protein